MTLRLPFETIARYKAVGGEDRRAYMTETLDRGRPHCDADLHDGQPLGRRSVEHAGVVAAIAAALGARREGGDAAT